MSLELVFKPDMFEDSICATHEMSLERLFYCFVNLVFSEFKALEDFVCDSTYSVDRHVNLYLLLFCVKASSNAIAFKAFDLLFPFLGFTLNLVYPAKEFAMMPFRPNDS